MTGFSDDDLGRWLLLNGALLTLQNGPNALPMKPNSIEADNLDGGWFITFVSTGSGKAWLRSVDLKRDVVVNNIQDAMVLPNNEADKTNLESFVKRCRIVLE